MDSNEAKSYLPAMSRAIYSGSFFLFLFLHGLQSMEKNEMVQDTQIRRDIKNELSRHALRRHGARMKYQRHSSWIANIPAEGLTDRQWSYRIFDTHITHDRRHIDLSLGNNSAPMIITRQHAVQFTRDGSLYSTQRGGKDNFFMIPLAAMRLVTPFSTSLIIVVAA